MGVGNVGIVIGFGFGFISYFSYDVKIKITPWHG